MLLPLAQNRQLDRVAHRGFCNVAQQGPLIGWLMTVIAQDHVTDRQPSLFRRPVRQYPGDDGALGPRHAIGRRNVRRHLLQLHADPAGTHPAIGAQPLHHEARAVRRDGKPQSGRPGRRRDDRRIDPDDVALHVEQRTAGIAMVDRRIRLDQVVIRRVLDVAVQPADDPGGDRQPDAKRIARGKHLVTDLQVVAVAPVRRCQRMVRIHLHQRQIRQA